MAIIIRHNGLTEIISPENGKKFDLLEVVKIMDAQVRFVEEFKLGDELHVGYSVKDRHGVQPRNLLASYLMKQEVRGNVIVIRASEDLRSPNLPALGEMAHSISERLKFESISEKTQTHT